MGGEQPVDIENVKRLAYGPSSAGLPADYTTAIELTRDKYPPEDGQHVEEYRQKIRGRLEDRTEELKDAPEKGLPLLQYAVKKMNDGGSFSMARVGGLSTGVGLIAGGSGTLAYQASQVYTGDEVSTVALGLAVGSAAAGSGLVWVSRNGFRPTYSKLLKFSERIVDQTEYYEEAIQKIEQQQAQSALDDLEDPTLEELDDLAEEYGIDTIELNYDHENGSTARNEEVEDVLTGPMSMSYYHPKGAYHVLAWVEDDHWVREDFYEPWSDLLKQTVKLCREGRPVVHEEEMYYPESHMAAEGIEPIGEQTEWMYRFVDRPR